MGKGIWGTESGQWVSGCRAVTAECTVTTDDSSLLMECALHCLEIQENLLLETGSSPFIVADCFLMYAFFS